MAARLACLLPPSVRLGRVRPAVCPGPLGAIATLPWLGRVGDVPKETLRVVVDETTGATGGLRSLRRDVPESFRHRRFGHRYVREFTVPAVQILEEA